ncbi:unnamed protein product [Effrenium voratum]|nr:unnamed protein product [Effrenium voratum]
MARACGWRAEPGEDLEDFLPLRPCNSEPQLRRIPPSLALPCDTSGYEGFSREDESPSQNSQALHSMVERLYDEELRKREERHAARIQEREQELASQAPFAPALRRRRGADRVGRDSSERHLHLYDQRLEMAERKRQLHEQKLRNEREYLESHSVHRARSPQADPTLFQRLHEEAEIRRHRMQELQEEKAATLSPSRRAANGSRPHLRLFELASERIEKRNKLQKMKEEQEAGPASARSPQAHTARISQRLFEEGQLRQQRLMEKKREKEIRESESLVCSPSRRKAKDTEAIFQRLFKPERRRRVQDVREEEEQWLRMRRHSNPAKRMPSFHLHKSPSESPKAIPRAQVLSEAEALKEKPSVFDFKAATAELQAPLKEKEPSVDFEVAAPPEAAAVTCIQAEAPFDEKAIDLAKVAYLVPEEVCDSEAPSSRRISLELDECW